VSGAGTLHADVRAFIESGVGDFDDLALRLFAHQYAHDAPYRRFCDGRGVTPETATSWRDVPPAPASAFKRHALTCAPEAACVPSAGGRTFHSSGTTGAETSRHYLDAPALDCYRASLRRGYADAVTARYGPLPIFALLPDPEEAPHSSLSFMLGELIAGYGGAFFWGDNWPARLSEILAARAEPVAVFGTAFAWVHLLDALPPGHTLPLPPGSVILETGGFKGRSREVARGDLYAAFEERFVVPPDHCLSEYGMSEMASQFYSVGDDPKTAPPWVRTRALDPVAGRDARPGEPGLLAHYDLANVNSVFALQTEDLGIPTETGFHLLGRAPGAVLRGCSLTAEEAFR
jgi:hypothetical protein